MALPPKAGPFLILKHTFASLARFLRMLFLMNANYILSIPLDQPERLFKHQGTIRNDYLQLLKTWHPDLNKDPKANDVTARLHKLYEKAKEKLTSKTWQVPGLL